MVRVRVYLFITNHEAEEPVGPNLKYTLLTVQLHLVLAEDRKGLFEVDDVGLFCEAFHNAIVHVYLHIQAFLVLKILSTIF